MSHTGISSRQSDVCSHLARGSITALSITGRKQQQEVTLLLFRYAQRRRTSYLYTAFISINEILQLVDTKCVYLYFKEQ